MPTIRVTSPIKWHGGKYYLAPKMKLFLPKKYLHRVHPYGGGVNEIFSWGGDGVSEVINDCNHDLMNFWRVLQDKDMFEEFQLLCNATPFSELEFVDAKETLALVRKGNPVRLAHNFFVRCRQSRQGLMKDFATVSTTRLRRGMNEQVSAWLSSIEGLPAVHERLKRVMILNEDAIKVICEQDSPDTFFYLDPPYLQETRTAKDIYEYEMTPEQHQQLLDLLGVLEGKFMLSGYPSEMYAAAAKKYGWRHHDFDLPNNASSKKSKDRKIERIWMNYQAA